MNRDFPMAGTPSRDDRMCVPLGAPLTPASSLIYFAGELPVMGRLAGRHHAGRRENPVPPFDAAAVHARTPDSATPHPAGRPR
jgi:hypothetical protein